MNPALFRGMTQPRHSRRDILRIAGLSAAGFALAACGVEGKKAPPPKVDEVAKFWAGKSKNGKLNWANWALYMETEGKSYPLLDRFTKETGIQVTYKEVIEDNPSFFGQIEPQLRVGQSIGYDLMVITNGAEFSKLRQLGYLTPLDHGKLPNFTANAGKNFQTRSYDPGNVYSVPYTTGFTGLAYNMQKTGREITSIQDLWDPKFTGKVGMFADVQELGNFGMFAIGVDPEKSTPADWKNAAAKLKELNDKGIVRKYMKQDYIEPIVAGDLWIAMGWSGDVFQQALEGKEHIRFAIPKEGATIWTDNMMIPKGAENPVDAITMMDWLYKPENAAELIEFIQYITPVPAVKDLVVAHAAEAKGDDKASLEAMVKSPLIFPGEADYGKFRTYRTLTPSEEQEYRSIFQPLVEG